jgi:hypothetical protein
VSPTAAPLSPGAQQAAAAFDKQGPLHDGLITLPIPSECQIAANRRPVMDCCLVSSACVSACSGSSCI